MPAHLLKCEDRVETWHQVPFKEFTQIPLLYKIVFLGRKMKMKKITGKLKKQ